jgi:bacillaene synthase trans-acting acyltransferase
MHVGERIVRRKLGRSLLAELYGRSHTQVFDDLRLSHPALLMTEYAIYRVLISEGIAPDAVWGSSLGEFVAAVASGAWSYETAMDAVLEHARLVTAHCEPGGMLAVLGGLEHYDALVAEGIPLTLAGVNFAMHFTLAGTPAALDRASERLSATGVSFLRLPVRYAFHSPAVTVAQEPFATFCSQLPAPSTPRIPYLSGLDGKPVAQITHDYLWQVIRQPMAFAKALAEVDRGTHSLYVDCGPSGTLATFAKYALPKTSTSTTLAVVTPFKQAKERIDALKSQLLGVHA